MHSLQKFIYYLFFYSGKSKDAAIKVESEKEPDLKYLDQCPDSFDAETAINLMLSYVSVWFSTDLKKWL